MTGPESSPPPAGAPLPRSLVLGWGLGSLGSSTLHNGIAFLGLFFMSEVLGIAPAVAGSLLVVAKLYDIVTDPLMGWVSDRTRSPWGRRRPWLLAGALTGGAAFALLFNATAGSGALVTCGAALLLYATAYTLFGVPYLAMPAEMTADYHDRSRLMSARTIFLSLGILAGGALAPALAGWLGDGSQGYARMGWVLGLLITVAMGGAFLATAGARQTAPAGPSPGLAQQWRSALGNRPFTVLILSKLCHLVGVSVSMSSLAFLVTAVLERSTAVMGGFVLASVAGSIASMPLWLRCSRAWGKRNTYWLAAAVYLPVLASWLLAGPAEADWVLVLRGIATGLATGGLTLTAQALLPDTIEHDFRRTGLRREGSFSAVYSMAEKLAAATGPFLVGLTLQSGGTAAVLLTAVGVPALATGASALVLRAYHLDRELRAGMGGQP